MAKGLFTQGMCVLLSGPVSVERLRDALDEFDYLGAHDSVADSDSSKTLVFRYRDESAGHLLVTLSDVPWPDDLGDPEATPERFIAWSLGQYGPYAFPGCLRRAGEQSWGWEEGHEAITAHQCHLRFLISYVFGSEDVESDSAPSEPSLDDELSIYQTPTSTEPAPMADDEADGDDDRAVGGDDDRDDDADELASEVPLLPADYDPHAEMTFVTRAVEASLQLPEALCYFNPAGEVLRDRDGLRRGLNHAWSHELPPLEMWTNVRLFQAEDGWSLMDTVGNYQFDVPDLEAVFCGDQYEPAKVEEFLRSASLYMLKEDEDVEDGDTADGPGDVQWRAMQCTDGLSDPPRETIRWFPEDSNSPPDALCDPGDEDESELDDDDASGDDVDGLDSDEFLLP